MKKINKTNEEKKITDDDDRKTNITLWECFNGLIIYAERSCFLFRPTGVSVVFF